MRTTKLYREDPELLAEDRQYLKAKSDLRVYYKKKPTKCMQILNWPRHKIIKQASALGLI